MDRAKFIQYLESKLNDHRIRHSLGVEKAAVELAERFGYDKEKAAIAGLMHDCAKWMSDEEYVHRSIDYGIKIDEIMQHSPSLLHGSAGAHVLKHDFGILDQDILDAVCYHCLPRLNPTELDMIVAVADLIELNRKYTGIETIRKLARVNIKQAFLASRAKVMAHVIEQGQLLQLSTVMVYNKMIMDEKKDK